MDKHSKITILGLIFLFLGGCDGQNAVQKKIAAEKTAEAERKESEDKQKIEALQKAAEEATKKASQESEIAEKEKLTNEIKAHFNQAFSYIGSAKAANNEQKEKLFLNAEKEFSNILLKNPNHVEALLNRGVIYMALGKLNKAEEDLKKASGLDPKNASANYNLACLYSVTNKIDLAADALDNALQNGFNDYDRLRNDPDLNNIRKVKDFQRILEKNKIFIK